MTDTQLDYDVKEEDAHELIRLGITQLVDEKEIDEDSLIMLKDYSLIMSPSGIWIDANLYSGSGNPVEIGVCFDTKTNEIAAYLYGDWNANAY